MSVIECKEMIKTYKRSKALNGISFTIEENKIVGLIGRNGAGKTTLMKILAGFIRESLGEVKVFSKRPFNNLLVSANTIFIDDQMNFPSALTLSEILEEANRFYENWDGELALRLFQHFGFDSKQIHRNLSKGKKSTFNMIVGLSARCPLTIFDEPTTGMDAAIRKDFYRALLKDYLDHPRTIILSSHHLEEMEDLLEEVLLIEQGEKYLHLPMADVSELAIGLTGKVDLIAPWIKDQEVLHKKAIGQGDVYVAVKNRFSAEELKKIKFAEIEVSSVSASDVCIYVTAKAEGSIDDVFN